MGEGLIAISYWLLAIGRYPVTGAIIESDTVTRSSEFLEVVYLERSMPHSQ